MLVLARQREETIMIGDAVEVTVVDIRGDKVRLGINAPKNVPVHRKEVYTLIKQQQANQVPQQVSPEVEGFLHAALEEAKLGLSEGGLPIGSVLVRNGQIIGRGHNRRVQNGDPMAHAEIDCLTQAGRQVTYKDCVLYSTLMPCFLCSGAVVQFGIPKVIVGESVNHKGDPSFMRSHGVEVIDLHHRECIHLMAGFIKDHPQLWNEDIGK